MLVYEFLKNLKNLYLNEDFKVEDDAKLYEKELLCYKVYENPSFITIIFSLLDNKFKDDEQKSCHILLDPSGIQLAFVGDEYLRKIPIKNIDLNTIGDDTTVDHFVYGRILQDNMSLYLTNDQIDKLVYLFSN